MSSKQFNNYSNKCYSILENSSPQQAIALLAEVRHFRTNEKLGFDNALKIYKLYSEKTVKYDSKKYKNNITGYRNKIHRNINEAEEYCRNIQH